MQDSAFVAIFYRLPNPRHASPRPAGRPTRQQLQTPADKGGKPTVPGGARNENGTGGPVTQVQGQEKQAGSSSPLTNAATEKSLSAPKVPPHPAKPHIVRSRVPFWPQDGDFFLYQQLVEGLLRPALMPVQIGVNKRFVYGESLSNLFKNCDNETKGLPQADAVLVVQVGLSTKEKPCLRSLQDISTSAQQFLTKKKTSLLCLAVGESEELADWIASEDLRVLCWSNPLGNPMQHKFAFTFCYHMIEGMFRNRATKLEYIFERSITHFERKLHNGSHTYSLGLDKHGEPCLYPHYPARLYRQWGYLAFEQKLGQAAGACASIISALLDENSCGNFAHDRSNIGRPAPAGDAKQLATELAFCIGSYFAWLAFVRFSKDHNKLSRRSEMNHVEFAFSGENVTLEQLQSMLKSQRVLVAGQETSTLCLRNFDPSYAESVQSDAMQLFKVDMLGLGLLMCKQDHSSVVSRWQFRQDLEKETGAETTLFRAEFTKLIDKLETCIDDFRAASSLRSSESAATQARILAARRWRRRLTWIHNSFQVVHLVLRADGTPAESTEEKRHAGSGKFARLVRDNILNKTKLPKSPKPRKSWFDHTRLGHVVQIMVHASAVYIVSACALGLLRIEVPPPS